ncbi:MAG: hypothetical protein JF606_24180 [Burkholderiales bacterium]|nr:hypothetical protein [Burkholderiales bacterium]
MSNTSSSPDKSREPRPGATPAKKAPPKAPLNPPEESVAGEEDPGASLDTLADDLSQAPMPGGKKP